VKNVKKIEPVTFSKRSPQRWRHGKADVRQNDPKAAMGADFSSFSLLTEQKER